MIDIYEKTKKFLWEITKFLGLVISVSILVSLLFGPDVPFFGGVLQNVQSVIEVLGSEGLGLIIAIIIILSVWNSRSN
jgi:hypothetical protein